MTAHVISFFCTECGATYERSFDSWVSLETTLNTVGPCPGGHWIHVPRSHTWIILERWIEVVEEKNGHLTRTRL